MPPFQRKTLVLIGAQGVGRRSLKNRLIVMNPLRYGTTVPCECVRQDSWEVVALSGANRFPALVRVTTCPQLLPPVTSRHAREEERDGQNYCFVTREQMEKDIKESRYLEHGEYDGNLYGTKIDSIHEVVDAGRTCILDVNPQVSRRWTISACWSCLCKSLVVMMFFLPRPWKCWRLLSLCHSWCLLLLLNWTH